ncbi:Lrp/AsnC family transcriptional regulator [Sediminitomix flava]|uniref:AsnC family transcriptional regulator n=1 Tax=Sediminitomix flava TaxID=379075 RepID=A0A315ZCF0_SEDFL|nr:Lrp/AsnC family transcriptional regulator [Sediminitomix flava]PWJ42414.1 AsnC family transcriptional regulator [Sediminitomix flava]
MFQLDKVDVEILAHLQEDGRKSFTDIAEEMNTSVGTIRNRYTKLVKENILHIIGWTDPVRAGYNAYARVMIDVKPVAKVNQVTEELLKINEVVFLAHTSGEYNLEINLQCKDNNELISLMHESIMSIDGVYDTQTTMYFKVLKWASHDVSKANVSDK